MANNQTKQLLLRINNIENSTNKNVDSECILGNITKIQMLLTSEINLTTHQVHILRSARNKLSDCYLQKPSFKMNKLLYNYSNHLIDYYTKRIINEPNA